MSKPKTAFDSSGNLLVTLDRVYTFRNPKGRDLATIQRSLKSENITEVETVAAILSALSVDGLTFDQVLDLDADILLDLGGAVTTHFRVFSSPTV